MIWLALAYTAAILEVSSIYTRCTAIIFIRLLLSTTNFPEAKLSSTILSPIFWNYSKTPQQPSEIIQRLFRLQICLSRKSSAPENIQRLFRLQICLSRKLSTIFRKYSKTFGQQSITAINSSNQQQQPAAATSSSNQQQQPAAATSSSNQQQQPAAATSSSNQQQQPAAATSGSNKQQQQQQSTAAINSNHQQQQSTATINSSNQQHQPAAAFDNNNQLQQQPAFDLPASLPQSTTTHVR